MIQTKTFNQLNTTELYRLLQLRCEVFVVEQNCVYQDIDGIDLKSHHLWWEEKGEIVSCVRVYGDSNEVLHIGRVVTQMEFRGEGISRKLMLEAMKLSCSKGAKRIVLSGQKYLRSFYESLGFKVVTEEYLEDGIPHFGMEYKVN